MPNKNLTDSEIKKALEEHYKQVDKGYSDHLAYGGKSDEYEENYIDMLSSVVDLIDRQKAEIERLKDDNKFLQDNRWKELSFVKAEAYKEFAEEVNKELFGEEYQLDKAHQRAVQRVLNRLINKE